MSQPGPTPTVPRWVPSSQVIAALALGGILFAITVGKGVRDPDYFWHVVAGKYIVTHGQIPNVDLFSFTWIGQPWTPHEWLGETLIYILVAAFGEMGALAFFALLPALTLLVLTRLMAHLGIRTAAQVPVLALVALIMAPFATLRPQAVSWFLLALTMWLLASVTPEHRRRLFLLAPLFILWANLHGLYIVGIGAVAAYALFTFLGRTSLAAYRGWAIAAVGLCLAGAMLTPAGPLGVLYPLRYSQEWGLANIEEWQSPDFHNPAHWPLLLLVVSLIINGGRGAPGWMQMVAYVGVVMALVALRNSPVAAVLTAPTLALGLENRFAIWRGPYRAAPSRIALGRRAMEGVAGIAIVVGAAVIFMPRALTSDARAQQREAGYPVEAVDLLADSSLDVRVVPEYGWGGYAIYRLFDEGGRVFIDGRNDMYAEQILDEYTKIALADDGWQAVVSDYGVNALLFPPTRPIVKGLGQAEGWCEAYRDESAVLLLRECPPPS